jgi:hypothetical protein
MSTPPPLAFDALDDAAAAGGADAEDGDDELAEDADGVVA